MRVGAALFALAGLIAAAEAQSAQLAQSCVPIYRQDQTVCGPIGSTTCVQISGYVASTTVGQTGALYAFASLKDGTEVAGAPAKLESDTGSGTRQFSAVIPWPAAGNGGGRMSPVCDVRLKTQ